MTKQTNEDYATKIYLTAMFKRIGVVVALQILIELIPEDEEGETKFVTLQKELQSALDTYQKL